MNLSVYATNILIHVALMAIVLTIFFFFIATQFEKNIVKSQIDFVIKDSVESIFNTLSEESKEQIKKQINDEFAKQDFTKADEEVKVQNEKIFKKAWTFVGILVVFIMIIIIIIYVFNSNELSQNKNFLFYSGIISVIFVFGLETLFLFLIGQNYISARPNKIKLKMVNELYNNKNK